MEQPPPDQPPPNVPVAPPALNTRLLWTTLLAPMVLTAGFMILMIALGSGRGEATALSVGMVVVAIATVAGWVGFSVCIADRYEGPSKVLLILAYPILQVILVFGTFFVGCLVLVQRNGLY